MELNIPPEVTGPDAPGATPPGTETPDNGQPQGGDNKDGLILGKFKSQEDLAKAYAELEKKLGGGQKPDQEPEKKPEPEQDKKPETPAEGPKYVAPERTDADREFEKQTYGEGMAQLFEKAGLHAKSVSEFFHANGVFPDEAYAKLEAVGINRATVDAYLAGRKGQVADQRAANELELMKAQQQAAEIKASVGGDEGYTKLMSWAMVNLSAEDQAAYNRVMNSGDVGAIKLAVAGLHGKYTNALGNDPQLIQGGSAAPAQGDVFRSTAEVTAAMRDPRYKSDPAYREEVAAKLARSDVMKPKGR